MPHRLVIRSRIVQLAAVGLPNAVIATGLGLKSTLSASGGPGSPPSGWTASKTVRGLGGRGTSPRYSAPK